MNLQGDFEGAFLTSILQLLCEDQNTGILQVICGQNKCKVFFQQGTIVYAQSSQKSVRLGALLKRDGVRMTPANSIMNAKRAVFHFRDLFIKKTPCHVQVTTCYNIDLYKAGRKILVVKQGCLAAWK